MESPSAATVWKYTTVAAKPIQRASETCRNHQNRLPHSFATEPTPNVRFPDAERHHDEADGGPRQEKRPDEVRQERQPPDREGEI